MSTKKFTRWIDINSHETCLKITQKYHIRKEAGASVNLLKGSFIVLFLKRLFFVFVSLFRFNKNPYPKYWKSKNLKAFVKRILGFYKLEIENLLPLQSAFPPLSFKPQTAPLVSIIIAVHNNWAYTYNCLQSILKNTAQTDYEIILINDGSTDQTAANIKNISNITYLQNSQNLGFLKSCNKAAKTARGKYICFLNNDTQVRPFWLTNMIAVFHHDPDTGLVGSKLVYPYGLLQEAGGLVDSNGIPSNYGRFEDPEICKFNYLRETDYCSGACITLLKEDFEILNGFDEQFAPAYYEDTDLCFTIRYQLQKKVYYQPLSQVVHFEGISSGKVIKKGSVKEYQLFNADKFKNKWSSVFASFPSGEEKASLADKFNQKDTILFIDSYLPEYDKTSGSRRIFELIKIYRNLNFNIMFLPVDGERREPYYTELSNMGIRIIYTIYDHLQPFEELQELLGKIKIAWISRPEHNRIYAPYIRNNPGITWIYDTVDLHFVRMERGLKINNSATADALKEIEKIKKEEIYFAREADLTISITETEREILKQEGAKKIEVITNVHVPYTGSNKTFKEKTGICFIGGYGHAPNVDAVLWLANEIMPLVWKKDPGIKLTLLGSDPTKAVWDLQSPNVIVTGYLEDVSEHFISSRICVAPLRYGAGMKGKIGQSLEFSLPVITTAVGAEGMDLVNGYNALIANTTEDFANDILNLYQNESLWNLISSNSFQTIEKYSPAYIQNKIKDIFKLNNVSI
ncbi:glycosyltransferase [Pedobacter immunditicola]|uniref:glycosyltransferase n=1 Tax=Pedobacter immunditicola TaxID=3133440 RepID=UPI003097A0EC